jgi:hypothetical protein
VLPCKKDPCQLPPTKKPTCGLGNHYKGDAEYFIAGCVRQRSVADSAAHGCSASNSVLRPYNCAVEHTVVSSALEIGLVRVFCGSFLVDVDAESWFVV